MCRQILELELVPLSYEYVCLVTVNADILRRFLFLFFMFFCGPQWPPVVTHFSADGVSFPPTSAGDTRLLSVRDQRLALK